MTRRGFFTTLFGSVIAFVAGFALSRCSKPKALTVYKNGIKTPTVNLGMRTQGMTFEGDWIDVEIDQFGPGPTMEIRGLRD